MYHQLSGSFIDQFQNIQKSNAQVASPKAMDLATKIDAIAKGILDTQLPPSMNKAHAIELINLSKKATAGLMEAIIRAKAGAPEISSQINSVRASVLNDFQSKIGRIESTVRATKPGGIINSDVVKGNVALMLNSIAGGYQALSFFHEIRPAFLFLPGMTTVAQIGQLVAEIAVTVSETLKEGLAMAGVGAGILIDLLKWGAIGGGLLLVYKVLKP